MRYVLALIALSSAACAPGEVERTDTYYPKVGTCTAMMCPDSPVCGPVVNGKQSCVWEPVDCNKCEPTASTEVTCVIPTEGKPQ